MNPLRILISVNRTEAESWRCSSRLMFGFERMRLSGAFDAASLLLTILLVNRRVDAVAESSRHLVYPTPAGNAATKVQLVFGLGIPMEVEVSTIVGYVMKCNYNLPYNASYLSEPYVRHQRSTAAIDEDVHSEAGRAESRSAVGRYEIYKILESAKPCLLRAICEVAATPLNVRRSLAAQLLHIFLTPSTTSEKPKEHLDQEYLAAEEIGRSGSSTACNRAFHECRTNLLDYISRFE